MDLCTPSMRPTALHLQPHAFKLLPALIGHLQSFLPPEIVQQVLNQVSEPLGRASTFRIVHAGREGSSREAAGASASCMAQMVAQDAAGDLNLAPAGPLHRCTWYQNAYVLPLPALQKHQILRLSAVQKGEAYFQVHLFQHRGRMMSIFRSLRCSCTKTLCFQGLASMLPPLCLHATPAMKVLDLCAAPGGKATLIAGVRPTGPPGWLSYLGGT